MKRLSALAAFMLGLMILAVGACASGSGGAQAQAASASSTQITIDNFVFTPQTITVPAGTTVTWTNKDDVPHTVVENNQKFKSRALDTDESFSYKFDQPGTYDYFCSVHPKMVAKVIVQ